MKKPLYLGLVLSILLLAAGCTAQEPESSPLPSESLEPSPTPSVAPTPKPTESTEVYTRDMVFDDDGNLILSENRPANSIAAIWCIKEFTTEEVMKLAPYNDGALATAVCGTLSDRLLEAKEKINLFMKGQDTNLDQIYDKFGIDYNLLSLLMRKGVDKDGHLQIRWGEQKIA